MIDNIPQATVLLETEYWKLLLNPDQQNLGKCLVVLKTNKSSLAQLNEVEWREFGNLVKNFETTITELFSPTHFNWQCLMNNAFEQDSKELPRIHWHVAPRYNHPASVGNYEFIDENYPRTNKSPRYLDKDIYDQVAKLIQTKLRTLA